MEYLGLLASLIMPIFAITVMWFKHTESVKYQHSRNIDEDSNKEINGADKRDSKMPAETGLIALALKNITFLGVMAVSAVSATALAFYRLSGLEAKHKALQAEVKKEFIDMRETQRVADLEHLREINRIEKQRSEDRLETQKSLHALQVEGLRNRGPSK